MSKKKLNNINSNLIIEESVRILNREKQRKDNLETKASTLLNTVTLVITILISVIGFIISSSAVKNPLFFIFYVLGIIFLTITMMTLLLAVRTKGYVDPFVTEDVDEIRFNFKNNDNKLRKHIVQEYTKCFVIAFTNNNNKVKFLKLAECTLTTGTIFVILSIIILISLKVMNII